MKVIREAIVNHNNFCSNKSRLRSFSNLVVTSSFEFPSSWNGFLQTMKIEDKLLRKIHTANVEVETLLTPFRICIKTAISPTTQSSSSLNASCSY